MTEAIIVALITGLLTLFGTIVTSLTAAKKSEKAMEVSQAVTNTKIEELTREVREHNGFARRLPVVEEQINAIHNRLDNLEHPGN